MALSNYTRSQGRHNGGIRTIGLIDQREIASATIADATYTAITFSEGCCFSRYEFREDEAEYKETLSVSNGALVVAHELKFLLDKMGEACSQAISTLAEAAENGLVAIVLTTNGDSFIVGHSAEFGKERPLRFISATGTTGKQLSESTGEVITLRSQDVSKAKPYTGDFDTLFVAAS